MKLCGCGKHTIDETGDVYAQHRLWSWSFAVGDKPNTSEALTRGRVSPVERAPGVGISAPETEPLALDDPTGDDVARDAYRTTGGRTLDDAIDGCRAPRLAVGGAVVSKHAGGISLTSDRYERLAVTRADSERRLERASQRRTAEALKRANEALAGAGLVAPVEPTGVNLRFNMPAHAVSREALHRFEQEVLSTMDRARKVSGCPVIGPDTPVAINKHGEAVLVGDPSAVTGPVGVALEAPQASLGYSFKLMPATSGPERMVSEAIARRAKVVLFQQIQEMFTSGLIEESEASAWARRALGMEDPER